MGTKWTTLALVALVFLVILGQGEAGRRRDNRRRPCKYSRGPWGDCDPETSTMTRTLTLRKGDPNECKASFTKTRTCGGKKDGQKSRCRYNKSDWSECDPLTSTQTRTLTLRNGDAAQCEATVTKTRRCPGEGRRKKSKKPCKYGKTPWSECDASTNTQTRIATLKRGDPQKCDATQTKTRKCRKACKYNRAAWSECDTTTNTQTRTVTLKRGDPEQCKATVTKTRNCKSKKACKYARSQWSECDATTNTQTRTVTLKRGDPEVCQASLTKSRKCRTKKDCRYKRGPWGECDPNTSQKSRVLTLKKGDSGKCPATVTKRKRC